MKTFLLSLHSEYYKTRKTLAFWGAIVLPVFLCTVVFIGYYIKADDVMKKLAKVPPIAIWGQYSFAIVGVMGTLLLPMYLVFMTYSVNNIEHKADTWKSLFSLPIPKWKIYYSKALYTVLLITLSMLLFVGLTLAYGYILGWLKPQLTLQNADMAKVTSYLAVIYLKMFLASLGIISIQFLMSLVWKDFLKPMGIGFLLLVTAMIVLKWEYSYLIPFTHPIKALMSSSGKEVEILTKEVWVSFAYAAVFFTAGYFIVIKKSVK
ncbi:ABC transporter permease [Pedobacter cryophilus]|uniref:ABC transporter permease n=1 Tax=Pedobacter cryophilus TaxID=2571271 RepID=A0A4U1C5H1_9SPHI|nr:ABC transporter permease [Pedobacter cryophilus]TKC00673.1 ABC transporter permease [Pedobacter cryophilus]